MDSSISLTNRLHLLSLQFSSDDRDQVSDFTLQAAELAMNVIKTTDNAQQRNEARTVCSRLLDEASRIKEDSNYHPNLQSLFVDIRSPGAVVNSHVPRPTRDLTKREQIIQWSASALNGSKFPPWSEDPSLDVFMTSDPFHDAHEYSMSADQLAILDAWKRPQEIARPFVSLATKTASPVQTHHSIDLVQEAGTDCSIVAALSAAVAKSGRTFPEMLCRRMFPYDDVKKSCMVSSNGKYILRFFFNGCDRMVIIDDRLPFSKTDTLLHIVDRHNPELLWPALLEKAYLKVRGGYDFPGSNSATDLWMIAGWLPEEIFFSSKEFDSDRTWSLVQRGLADGTLLATLGTGKMSETTSESLGLVSNHNYAILDCKLEQDRLAILIKNPWVNGLTWNDIHASSNEQGELAPEGCFWMSAAAVVQHFETLYLNWDPRLFAHREDVHFAWDLCDPGPTSSGRAEFFGRDPYGSMLACPQYVVENRTDRPADAIAVLSKYFTNKSPEPTLREEFMSIYAFAADGKRVLRRLDSLERNEYSSSPHSLLRLHLEARQRLTLAISQQEFAAVEYSFTLSAYANASISLYRAASPFQSTVSCSAAWTNSTAGGHFECANHTQNPQFSLTLAEPSNVALAIETLDPHLDIHVRLLHGKGHRCHEYGRKDIILDSGEYTKNFALAKRNDLLQPGSYTAICSSFHAGATGTFKLSAMTDCRATLVLLPRDGAGMFCKQLANADLGGNARRVRAPMKLYRESKLYFTGRILTKDLSPHSTNPMRITLDHGSGPDRVVLVASNGGQFALSNKGFRTEPITLTPHMVGKKPLWLSVERISGTEGPREHHEVMEIELWHDSPQAAEIGVWREWDP